MVPIKIKCQWKTNSRWQCAWSSTPPGGGESKRVSQISLLHSSTTRALLVKGMSIVFLWFSIYHHTVSNETFNRREFVRALMEASEQAKDHKSVDQDRWKCHLMRSLSIVQIRNDTSLNNFPSSSDTVVRYAAELFYMAPLYHLAFTNITNMVVIDATDLEFHDSLQILQGEMDQVWFSIL